MMSSEVDGVAQGRDALLKAVSDGDATAVDALLADDASLAMVRDDQGVSALMKARYMGHPDVAQALLAAGPPLDVFEAATFDDADRTAALLDGDGALARAWSADGFTALHFAAFFGGEAAARLLLDAGADPDAVSRNELRVTPLHSATAGRREVALLLISRGADVNARQRRGLTPLHAAFDTGDEEVVAALLAAGADPAAADEDGLTPAERARRKGSRAGAG